MKITPPRMLQVSQALRRQYRLPASYYRGGTSRAIIFHAKDLPAAPPGSISHPDWARVFRGCIGSPDPNGRQLDGMGGGISSLSKVCIIGPATKTSKKQADVEYTFAAIGVKDDEVDYSSNCGNMTAAVGPWAWDHGLVGETRTDGVKVVRILNMNTGKVIRSTFSVRDGEAVVEGDMEIAGVAGKGAPIQLDFLDPAGSKTGKLFPTGKKMEDIDGLQVSCVDAGNPCVFVRATNLKAQASILPEQFDQDKGLRARLEKIRRLAGVKMGLAETSEDVPGSIPKICMVAEPNTHTVLSGEQLKQENFDLMARAVSVGQPHRAVPITVALCLAVAAESNTVVRACLSDKRVNTNGITLGHPSGTIVVGAEFDDKGRVTHATLFRTARRLFEGMVFWKDNERN